jgi:hypothetical protein
MLDGEPVFLLRAQDSIAGDIVAHYLTLARAREARNTNRTSDQLDRIIKWQKNNPKKVKLPD